MPTCHVISALALALAGVAPPTGVVASDLWGDRSLQVKQTSKLNFPPALAAEGIGQGMVRAVLSVDADGKLVDCLVTAYTRRELADELVANLSDWDYEPARHRGSPVGSRIEAEFEFQARGMVLSLTSLDAIAASTNRLIRPEVTSLVCRSSELDQPVRTLHVVEPQHPGDHLSPSPAQPTVAIDFYIDMEGRPRMPVAVRAAHQLYAIAAVDALMQWRFAPPTRQGRPMIVRATQLFRFSEPSSKPR